MKRYGLRDDQLRGLRLSAGASRHGRRSSELGNPPVCRGGDLEIPVRRSVERFAGALPATGRTSTSAFHAGRRAGLGESFQDLGR